MLGTAGDEQCPLWREVTTVSVRLRVALVVLAVLGIGLAGWAGQDYVATVERAHVQATATAQAHVAATATVVVVTVRG